MRCGQKYHQAGLILVSSSRNIRVEGERTQNSASIDSRRHKISSGVKRLPSKRWRCKRYKQPLIRADIYQQTAGGLWKPTLSFHCKGFSWMCNIHAGFKRLAVRVCAAKIVARPHGQWWAVDTHHMRWSGSKGRDLAGNLVKLLNICEVWKDPKFNLCVFPYSKSSHIQEEPATIALIFLTNVHPGSQTEVSSDVIIMAVSLLSCRPESSVWPGLSNYILCGCNHKSLSNIWSSISVI